MSLHSKNPGHWRTAARGTLKSHRATCANVGEANGKPIDGSLDPSTVGHGGNRKGKRITHIPMDRTETRTIHRHNRAGKRAARKAAK